MLSSFAHHRFVAEGVRRPHKPRAPFRRQTQDQADEARQAVLGGGGGAFLNFGIEDEAHIGDPVGMEGVMAVLWSPGCSRRVRRLMSIEQFNRGVAVDN